MIQHRISGRYTFAARFLARTGSDSHDNPVRANGDGHRLSHCTCLSYPAPMIAMSFLMPVEFSLELSRGRSKRRQKEMKKAAP